MDRSRPLGWGAGRRAVARSRGTSHRPTTAVAGASYHRVAAYARDEGWHFGIKEQALRKALAEEGVLETDDDGRHKTSPQRIRGELRRVLKLARPAVEKIMGHTC